MPISFVRDIPEVGQLGCWLLNESEIEMESLFMESSNDIFPEQKITNASRKMEWLCKRVLLSEMLNDRVSLTNLPSGVPVLNSPNSNSEKHLSISHSGKYLCALITDSPVVGVDIAEIDERAARIRNRFLSSEETALGEKNDEFFTTAWACKEAAFKGYDQQGIIFSEDIQILELVGNKAKIKLCKMNNLVVSADVEYFDNHVLVYLTYK